ACGKIVVAGRHGRIMNHQPSDRDALGRAESGVDRTGLGPCLGGRFGSSLGRGRRLSRSATRSARARTAISATQEKSTHTWVNNRETQVDSYRYESDGTRRTAVSSTYDAYGNVLQETAWGSCPITGTCTADGDEKTKQIDY